MYLVDTTPPPAGTILCCRHNQLPQYHFSDAFSYGYQYVPDRCVHSQKAQFQIDFSCFQPAHYIPEISCKVLFPYGSYLFNYQETVFTDDSVDLSVTELYHFQIVMSIKRIKNFIDIKRYI